MPGENLLIIQSCRTQRSRTPGTAAAWRGGRNHIAGTVHAPVAGGERNSATSDMQSIAAGSKAESIAIRI